MSTNPSMPKRAGPVLVNLADVAEEKVEFLWEPYVPRGKITIFEGNPGMGKTSLVLKLAAHLTTGEPLPGELGHREPSNVILMTCEDGLGDTIKPRLVLYGGNPSRVMVLQSRLIEDPETGELSLTGISLKDEPALRQAIETVQPSLVVVDPIQGFLGPKVDMNHANEVRPVMQTFGRLAEEFRFAAVMVRHLGKSSKDNAAYRGLGSIDFTAVARSILMVGCEPGNGDSRAMVHHKASCSQTGKTLTFTLPEGVFTWTGESDLTADDLLVPVASREERDTLAAATEFLREELSGGPEPVKELKRRAGDYGIADRALNRAATALKVRKNRESRGNGGDGQWIWRLSQESRH